MKRRGAVLVALVSACGVDLPLRDDVTYTCDSSADCPLELTCATLAHKCVAELDAVSPRLTSITATDRETVVLVFDEAVDASLASQPASFTITRDDGVVLAIQAAGALGDGKSIVLRTGRQRGAAIYTVTTTIPDQQGNPAQLDVDTFAGFGPAPDTEAPVVTAPTNASVIVVPESERTAPTVTLAWTPRSGAIAYTIEISGTESFATVDTTLVVSGDEVTHVLAVEEGRSYFWRVRSDATEPNAYGRGLFTVLFDTVYVSCPAAQAACRSGDGIGSKNVPLAAVSRAITLAADREVTNIAVASRGGSAGYHEPLGITGGGLTLRGGYNADFTGAVTDPTLIFYEGSVLTVIQTSAPLRIESLVLRAVQDPQAPTQALNAAAVQNADADVTFANCVLETTDIDGSASPSTLLPIDTVGLSASNGTASVILEPGTRVHAGEAFRQALAVVGLDAQLVVDGATLEAERTWASTTDSMSVALLALLGSLDIDGMTATAFTRGAQLSGAQGTIRGSSVVVRGTGRVAGVTISQGSATLDGNRIIASSSGSAATGVEYSSILPSVIANNTVVAKNGTEAAGVIVFIGRPLLVNDTFVLPGDTASATGVMITKETYPDLANLLIACLPGGGTSVGIREMDVEGDPLSVISNVVIGCDTPYRDEQIDDLTDLDTLAGQALPCPSCGNGRASGNETLASVDPFVSLLGADGLLDTIDNDLRLATSDPIIVAGGVDTASSACGSSTTPHDCGALTSDLLGNPRALPTSVGAYEKD